MKRSGIGGAVAVGLAVLVAAGTGWAPEARGEDRTLAGCTPRAGFAAAERLFAAINAGSPRRVLIAMTRQDRAGSPWWMRVVWTPALRDPMTLRGVVGEQGAATAGAAVARMEFDSPRQLARVLPLRHDARERLQVVAVRVGRARAHGMNRVLEAPIAVYHVRSARDLPAAEWGHGGGSKGMLSCARGSITGLNAVGGPLAGPLDADAVGRALCAGRHRAVQLAGRGWACH